MPRSKQHLRAHLAAASWNPHFALVSSLAEWLREESHPCAEAVRELRPAATRSDAAQADVPCDMWEITLPTAVSQVRIHLANSVTAPPRITVSTQASISAGDWARVRELAALMADFCRHEDAHRALRAGTLSEALDVIRTYPARAKVWLTENMESWCEERVAKLVSAMLDTLDLHEVALEVLESAVSDSLAEVRDAVRATGLVPRQSRFRHES